MSGNRNTSFDLNAFCMRMVMSFVVIGYSLGIPMIIYRYGFFKDMTDTLEEQVLALPEAAWNELLAALSSIGPFEVLALIGVMGHFFLQPETERIQDAVRLQPDEHRFRFLEVEDSSGEEDDADDALQGFELDSSDSEFNAPQVVHFNALEQRLKAKYDLLTLTIPKEFLDAVTGDIMVDPVLLLTPSAETTTSAVDKTIAEKIMRQPSPRDPISRAPVTGLRPLRNLKDAIERWVKEKEAEAESLPLNQLPREAGMEQLRWSQTLFTQRLNRERSPNDAHTTAHPPQRNDGVHRAP